MRASHVVFCFLVFFTIHTTAHATWLATSSLNNQTNLKFTFQQPLIIPSGKESFPLVCDKYTHWGWRWNFCVSISSLNTKMEISFCRKTFGCGAQLQGKKMTWNMAPQWSHYTGKKSTMNIHAYFLKYDLHVSKNLYAKEKTLFLMTAQEQNTQTGNMTA